MSPPSSTFRSVLDATVGDGLGPPGRAVFHQRIADQWQQSDADLVAAIEQHPQLLGDRSMLLNLAIEEFRSRRQRQSRIDLERHCSRFRRFGSSIERSIFRQLETQQYIDDHPELLALLGEPKWPSQGSVFVTFEILEELGSGGIARVYLCREPEVGNRQVVLKTTPFGGFEASVLGRLNHPNIVPIYSTGVSEEHGLQYLCMPYRGRSTLADLIDLAFQDGVPRDDGVLAAAAGRWLPTREAASQRSRSWLSRAVKGGTYVGEVAKIGLHLASALAYAHKLGILHGDLKPSNVLLTTDAMPLLLDFNLSQDREAVETLCGGTLAYMPPEQLQRIAAGASASASPPHSGISSDVYSFGALLYELLAGTTPAQVSHQLEEPAAVAKTLLHRLQRGFPSVRRHNRFVSRRLDALVRLCLAMDPAERPDAMEQVEQALAHELRLIPATGRQIRRRPLLWTAVLAGLIGAAGGIAAYLANRPPQHLHHYQRAAALAQAGDADKAAQAFSAALADKPFFRDALFERGRARIALDELDLATSDFAELVREQEDPSSMAYLGYCFNLLGNPNAAIAWYERALDHGAESAAVYNNLGASYLVARGTLSGKGRFQRAEECLVAAFQRLESSIVVQLNFLRLAKAWSAIDTRRSPAKAWPHAAEVLSTSHDDPLARFIVASWYAAVVDWEANMSNLGTAHKLSPAERSARKQFAKLIVVSTSPDRPQRQAAARPIANLETESMGARFYIDPGLN